MNHSSLSFCKEKPWLAPLAGWSDLPFRLLCRELGAAVCCSEMISAKGLVYGSPGTADLLLTSAEDKDVVIQLFGAEAAFMAEAAQRLKEQGFVWFDCNMGCSVPKVTRTGAGAAMLRDIDNTLAVAEALIGVVGQGRVGFKLRLGWDAATADTWKVLASELEQRGAGWLTLHPRTARQGFTGEARWDVLKALREWVQIPVIASGDLFTAQDGFRCLEETGVDTLMYARGALRNPAIFSDHCALLNQQPLLQPTAEILKARILRHAELALQYTASKPALLKMRTIVPRYVHFLPGARALRQAVIACSCWDDFYRVIQEHLG